MKKLKTLTICILFLCIFFISVSAKEPEIVGTETIRTLQPLGLRVKAEIDIETAVSNSTYEYGFIVTRKVFLDGKKLSAEDFTLDCGVPYTKGVSKGVVDGEIVDKFFEKNDTQLYFTGNIHGISPYYYSDEVVVRPYIIFDSGAEYGMPVTLSLYKTAKQMLMNDSLMSALTAQQAEIVRSIVVEVEGEPYEYNKADDRIVLSVKIVKNDNPTYSLRYDLLNPYTGEMLHDVRGRKTSKDRDELQNMMPQNGSVVSMYDAVVQDTHENFVVSVINADNLSWISDLDTLDLKMSAANVNSSLKCDECVDEFVLENVNEYTLSENVAVTVVSANGENIFENSTFSASTPNAVAAKDKSLLCTSGELYAKYVKAYVGAYNGECAYLLVVVNDNENAALAEKCEKHIFAEILERGRKQLIKIKITKDSPFDRVRDLLEECMEYVIGDVLADIKVDKGYIFSHYSSYTNGINNIMDKEMTSSDRSEFVNLLTEYVDEDVQDFLIEYFDIDMDSI